MSDYKRNSILFAALTFFFISMQAAKSFSAMNAEEVEALLSKGSMAVSAGAGSAKDVAASEKTSAAISLTALDMVNKIYGIVDPHVNKDDCIMLTERSLKLTPVEDENALWLETAAGYGIDYYGMSPDVNAMVRFSREDSAASDFGFFFLFPYTADSHGKCNREQAEFCGTLLQEMADEGLPLDLNINTDDLFEAIGDYMGSLVDLRLLDQRYDSGNGRYILILSVETEAFTSADYQVAELSY